MSVSEVRQSDNRIDLLKNPAGNDFLQRLITETKSSELDRHKHITNFERWYKKRFGIRPHQVSFPWRNASNLHLPLVDKTIRRAKPKFIRLVESVNPIVTLTSNILNDDLGTVRAVERKFDDVIREDMEIIEKVALGADKMLEKGYFIVKIVQEFTPVEFDDKIIIDRLPAPVIAFLNDPNQDQLNKRSEVAIRFNLDVEEEDDIKQIDKIIKAVKDDEESVIIRRKQDLTPHPSMFIRDPLKVLVPADTLDIRHSRWIRDRTGTSRSALLNWAMSNTFNKVNTLELLNRIKQNDDGDRDQIRTGLHDRDKREIELLEERREGITPTRRDLIELDEHYFEFKWPGDRLFSKSVLTLHRDHTDLPLRFIKYPYVDTFDRQDVWPFGQVTFEKVSDRYHAQRGFPQMLDSLQTEITNNHNAKQNYMTIANSINIKAKKNSNVTTQYIPGQPLWVNRMDDVEELKLGQRDISYDNEERILKSWAEEYTGLADSTLTSANNLTEPRTKAEIEKISEIVNDVAFGDVAIFQLGMNKIYKMIWNRWMQYGPDRIQIQTPEGGIMSVTKDEIKRRFKLRPTGNISNSSTEKRKRDALVRFQLYKGNQNVNQSELVRQALYLDDERAAETLFISGLDAQQSQLERQIFEIDLISKGYTSIPKLSDDDITHIKVIDDFLNDQRKNRNFPPDRLKALSDHRQAHVLAVEKKRRASTKGGRLQQEIANVARGFGGRQARQAIPGGANGANT